MSTNSVSERYNVKKIPLTIHQGDNSFIIYVAGRVCSSCSYEKPFTFSYYVTEASDVLDSVLAEFAKHGVIRSGRLAFPWASINLIEIGEEEDFFVNEYGLPDSQSRPV